MTNYGSCLQNPATLGASPTRNAGEAGTHCITCGDDGDPMTVVKIDDSRGLALCQGEEGTRMSVETALIEAVAPGDVLLVHAGTAIAVVSAAAETGGSPA